MKEERIALISINCEDEQDSQCKMAKAFPGPQHRRQAMHPDSSFLPPFPTVPALCLNSGHRTAMAIQPPCDGECRSAWWVPKVKGAGMRESFHYRRRGNLLSYYLFLSLTDRYNFLMCWERKEYARSQESCGRRAFIDTSPALATPS